MALAQHGEGGSEWRRQRQAGGRVAKPAAAGCLPAVWCRGPQKPLCRLLQCSLLVSLCCTPAAVLLLVAPGKLNSHLPPTCSSRQCQQKHWVAGHKHACKKLRKQLQQAVKLGTAATGAHGSVQTTGAAGGKGSSQRPEESNSLLPVPSRVLYPCERYAELAAAPPQRTQPLGLQNVGNRRVCAGLQHLYCSPPAG